MHHPTERVAGIGAVGALMRRTLFDLLVGAAIAAFVLYNLPEWPA